MTGHSACRSLVPPPCGIRRGGHGAVQAQVSSPVPPAFPRRPREPGRAHPVARRRYLLCELVSEDPRCRLSLDDRVLGGLVRDTIARVHGAFGAAACSVGFAGTRAPQMGCGARSAGRPGPCAAFLRWWRVLEKPECGESKTDQKCRLRDATKQKLQYPAPGVCAREIPLTARIGGEWVLNLRG